MTSDSSSCVTDFEWVAVYDDGGDGLGNTIDGVIGLMSDADGGEYNDDIYYILKAYSAGVISEPTFSVFLDSATS